MTVSAQVSRDQTPAVLLAALLGDFRLHHLYLRQPCFALLYLVFCWTGVLGEMWELEACRYGFVTTEAGAERYNGGSLGEPVPRWLPVALIILPLAILAALFAAIYAGYDF